MEVGDADVPAGTLWVAFGGNDKDPPGQGGTVSSAGAVVRAPDWSGGG